MITYLQEVAEKQYNQEVKMIGYSKYGYPLVRTGKMTLIIEDEVTIIYSDIEVKELVKKGELILL